MASESLGRQCSRHGEPPQSVGLRLKFHFTLILELTALFATMSSMAGQGLRQLKKVRTHRLIADVAARLFAERGYEHVTVSDVAREAEVSEQTVYNYFQTKEQLVIDRNQQVQDQLVNLIRARAPGVSAAAAIRDFVLAAVDGVPSISPEIWRGELGYL